MSMDLSSAKIGVLQKGRIGVIQMPKKTIAEIKRELGIEDDVQPMNISTDDDRDALEDADYFGDWYEEELREIYER